VFPVSTGSAEALVRCDGKIKYILSAYFLGKIYAKNCRNQTVYVKIIAGCKGETFFDTECIYISGGSCPITEPPKLPQNGDEIPKFVIFRTISTIKDEKSAAKFHYIKTVNGKIVAQSIAFRVVSIHWQGQLCSLDI